jgi:flagellar motor component MotA
MQRPNRIAAHELRKILADLKLVQARLERMLAVHHISAMMGDPAQIVEVRGRKSVSPEERKRISARMKAYWAARRAIRRAMAATSG